MKIISILLLTAMVAIEKEQCSAKYLLVDFDDAEGRGSFYTFPLLIDNMILNNNLDPIQNPYPIQTLRF